MAKLVLLSNHSDLYEALCVKASLDAAGLFTFIPDQHVAGSNWAGGTTLLNIRLLVMDTQLEEARGITGKPNLPPSDAVMLCPQCGSSKTAHNVNIFLAALTILTMATPVTAKTKRFICLSCKHRWVKNL